MILIQAVHKMDTLKKLTKELTVLYVEDEDESREQIEGIFKLLFKSVDSAVDGLDALEKYKVNTYDIVITDINMPKMNGLELIEHIRTINETQKIIIISAHNNSEYLIEAINKGIDNFILKPIKTDQLKFALTKISNLIYAQRLLLIYHEELEKEVEEKTVKLANLLVTDELTGLLNRSALTKESKIDNYRILLLLNIDNFDSYNVTYGYYNGDIILQEVASFLKENVKNSLKLYRVGSDEFGIIFTKTTLEYVELYANKLRDKILQHSIKIDNFNIKLTFTMAIAEGNGCLLKNAYIALKEAYKSGKNRINIYQKNSAIELLQARIQEYMPRLRKVIANRYITPYFQPIINNKTGEIEKYECLARIIDEDNNVQSPFEFIDIAELTGMIPDITRIMIDKSFKAFAENDFEFSINISEYDLNDGYLGEYLQSMLNKYNISASRVVLEVLEGISTNSAQKSLEQLMDLKKDGYSIAIDDFGVQNSNFERVHSMDVDFIKIDGSFIKKIYHDERSYSVAKTITDFSKSIGAKVIAEYVHSKEVQDIIIELGIDYSQGYYFSKPKKSIF